MFKTGQLIRRVKIHEGITPTVPLGGIVRVTENFQSRKVMTDSVTPEQESTGELKVLYHNGTLLLEDNFETIRTRAQQ